MIDIAVVDYGMGNLRSVSKALEHVAPNKNVVVTSRPADIKQASRVVFPGQGAMPDCMRELESRGLRDAIVDAAATKPFLGICIGLQLQSLMQLQRNLFSAFVLACSCNR